MESIKRWGLPPSIINEMSNGKLEASEIARVTAVHKDRYVIEHITGKKQAEITGNLRYSVESNLDFPAVGDWVKVIEMDAENAVILDIFPRFSSLKRKSSGKTSDAQMIATNINAAFVCMSLDQNFNLNRLERYMAICLEEDIEPIIILTKSDLVDTERLSELKHQIKTRHPLVKLLSLSTHTQIGMKDYMEVFISGKTYCFLGSSGVGKSTLVNDLLGSQAMKTSELSDSNQKGRHTTSHRELFLLPNGSLVIDSPGMRELGMAHTEKGIDAVFSDIAELVNSCKYKDCTHTSEPGCAILKGLEEGEISEEAYENYLKLRKEEAHFSEKEAQKRQKGKQLSKVVKEYYKLKKRNQE